MSQATPPNNIEAQTRSCVMKHGPQLKLKKTTTGNPRVLQISSESVREHHPQRLTGRQHTKRLQKDNVATDQIEDLLVQLDSIVINSARSGHEIRAKANDVLQEIGRISLSLYREKKLSQQNFAAPVTRMLQTTLEATKLSIAKRKDDANRMICSSLLTRSPGP